MSWPHALRRATKRLEGWKSLQWPVNPDGSDEPLLFTERFNFPDGKATFFPMAWSEPAELVDAEFDLHLNNGRGTKSPFPASSSQRWMQGKRCCERRISYARVDGRRANASQLKEAERLRYQRGDAPGILLNDFPW